MKLCDGLFVLPLFVLLLIMYSNALQIPSYETLVMFFTSSAQVGRGYRLPLFQALLNMS